MIADLDLTHTVHTNAGTYAADYWTFTDPTGNYNNVAATTITDIITKCLGTRNQVTVVKAAIKALSQLRTPQDVERLRGVSLT